jgi:hypothetical protein
LAKAVSALIDDGQHPLYIHCLDGRRITGLACLATRRLQGWTPQDSFAELFRYLTVNMEAMDSISDPDRISELQRTSRDVGKFLMESQLELTVPARIPTWLWGGDRAVLSLRSGFRFKFLTPLAPNELLSTGEDGLTERGLKGSSKAGAKGSSKGAGSKGSTKSSAKGGLGHKSEALENELLLRVGPGSVSQNATHKLDEMGLGTTGHSKTSNLLLPVSRQQSLQQALQQEHERELDPPDEAALELESRADALRDAATDISSISRAVSALALDGLDDKPRQYMLMDKLRGSVK